MKDMKRRTDILANAKFPKSRWIEFCEIMLGIGYKVTVKETHNTHSKYVRVWGAGDTWFQVRFSNHKPNRGRELAGDCDFFVGVTHTGVRTTAQAIKVVEAYFNAL